MQVAAIVPSYKVSKQLLNLLDELATYVDKIYVIDDCCPEDSWRVAQGHSSDKVVIHQNSKNLGVGGAVKQGMKLALLDRFDIIVKVDGDGQMDPSFIPNLIAPILNQNADYTKGNRFYKMKYLKQMPFIRVVGNLGVSFFSKLSSGYWHIMDPANGFIAAKSSLIREIELDEVENRYFFESDMLYHIGLLGASVQEVPMHAKYNNETSNLNIISTLFTFPQKYLIRTFKRIVYNYYVRDFNLGSISLLISFLFLVFGTSFGGYHWIKSIYSKIPATSGTVMLAAISIILGIQFFMMFLQNDMSRNKYESGRY